MLGEIDLMVYIKGVILHTMFFTNNLESAYNAILKIPWLHKMKVTPSTYQ